jgi:hypothetical protein
MTLNLLPADYSHDRPKGAAHHHAAAKLATSTALYGTATSWRRPQHCMGPQHADYEQRARSRGALMKAAASRGQSCGDSSRHTAPATRHRHTTSSEGGGAEGFGERGAECERGEGPGPAPSTSKRRQDRRACVELELSTLPVACGRFHKGAPHTLNALSLNNSVNFLKFEGPEFRV